jgi:radical SAM superfamily enzyme YgiQ (UPF0313 family)
VTNRPKKGKETRVILLSFNRWRQKDPRTPLGSAYLYAWLVSHLTETDNIMLGFIDRGATEDPALVAKEVLEANPSILGIGVYVWNCEAVRELTKLLRAHGYKGTIVLGGAETSYRGAELPREYPFADYFVKGEGEAAFEEIVRSSLEGRVPHGQGIFSLNSQSFEGQAHLPSGVNPVQPQSLPELIPLITKGGFSRIQFQRGCPYGCTFCAFPFKDRAFRELDLTSLKGDLSNLRGAGIRTLAILDPIFFFNKKRALDILDILGNELPGVSFEIQTRPEHLNEEIIRRLSSMNVLLECGIQTFDHVVQKAIKRGGNREQVMANLRSLMEHKVRFETHLIFGLPYQTLDSFLSDLDHLLSYRPERVRAFPLLDHKGTEMSNEVETKYRGMMSFSASFPRQVVSTKWMPSNEIVALKGIHSFLEDTKDPASAGIAARDTYRQFCVSSGEAISHPSG